MYRYIVSTFFARVTSTALNFFIVLVIARHAGPEIKGEVTLLITVSWFFIFLSNILGGQALIYLIPRNKVELLVVPAYIWSITVAVIGFIFLKSTEIIEVEHITSITVLSLLYSIIAIHQTILLAKKQINKANILQIISLSLQSGGIVFCFYILHINSAFAYIYASLIAYSVVCVISFFLIKPIVHFSNFLKDFSLEDLRVSFRYGFLFQIVEVFQLLNLRYYYFQLSLQEGNHYLGIYSIGIAVLEAVWLIPRSIGTVQYVSTSNADEIKEEASRVIQLLKVAFALSAVLLVIVSLIPPSVYIFVFGEGFRFTRHSMRFLFPGILSYNLVLVLSSFYLGTGRYKPLIISNLAGFITLAVCGYFLIPEFVMTGAGLAASISFTVASLFLLLFFTLDNKIAVSQFIITGKDIKKAFEMLKNLLSKNRKIASDNIR